LYQGVGVSFTEQLAMVETALQKLIRDWERFFAGDLRVPPHTERDRLQRRLRYLAENQEGSRAERFRFEQLLHRFQVYLQNWERMLREQEEGRGRSVAAVRAAQDFAPPPSNEAAPSSVIEPESESLYDQYVHAKQANGLAVSADRESFERQLAAKQKKLEAKLGRKVRFEVLVENGKVRLAARKTKDRAEKE
jgi:hypothetical protein